MLKKLLELATSRKEVVLLELIPADARTMFELIDKNRSHLSQWGDPTADAYPDYESVLRSIANPIDPRRIQLGIWCNGIFAGTINFTPINQRTREIDCWIGREFCQQGLAVLATRAVIDYGRQLPDVDTMTACAYFQNRYSRIVLTRSDMRETRHTNKFVWFSVNTKS